MEAAGQQFPGKAFMRVPKNAISAVSGIGWGEAYNPNALYGKMKSRASVYDPWLAQQPQGGLTLGAFSLGGVEEASQSEKLTEILDKHTWEKLTLTQDINATPAGGGEPVTIYNGTEIMLIHVSEHFALFYVKGAGDLTITDLAKLHAALDLGS
jgi:hypothetical protein